MPRALWFPIYLTFIHGFFRKSFKKLLKVFGVVYGLIHWIRKTIDVLSIALVAARSYISAIKNGDIVD